MIGQKIIQIMQINQIIQTMKLLHYVLFTLGKFYFVDLTFLHHRPSNIFSHGAQADCAAQRRAGENFIWKNTNTLSRTLTAENKNTTGATFVRVLRILACFCLGAVP